MPARKKREGGAKRAAAKPKWSWQPIDSSRLNEAAYDSTSKTLRVRFKDGTPWEYHNVHPNTWRSFLGSESKGQFIYRILDNHPHQMGRF